MEERVTQLLSLSGDKSRLLHNPLPDVICEMASVLGQDRATKGEGTKARPGPDADQTGSRHKADTSPGVITQHQSSVGASLIT